MLCSSGLPTSLKATCWIKAENNHTAPSQPPQPIALLSCLCLLCFPENKVASPLQQNHLDMARSQSSPGSQEPNLLVARMMPQQFLKVKTLHKRREEAKAGFQDKLFSCSKFPHISKHLPWTQHSPAPLQHTQAGRKKLVALPGHGQGG